MAMLPGESVAQYNARMQEETHAAWRRAVPPIGSGKMPSTSEMIVTKYMGHADVDPPIVVTVKTVTLENVGKEEEADQKWFMWFHEVKKGFRLNVTTIRILEAAWGMHTDLWIGKRIKLWWDPTVLFGGKPVGGVKVRLPTAGAAAAGVPPGARFDPNTGQPIVAAAMAPRFDPMTGKPLTAAMPGPRFDPNTGAPLNGVTTAPAVATTAPLDEFGAPAPAATDGEFVDDDIPF